MHTHPYSRTQKYLICSINQSQECFEVNFQTKLMLFLRGSNIALFYSIDPHITALFLSFQVSVLKVHLPMRYMYTLLPSFRLGQDYSKLL